MTESTGQAFQELYGILNEELIQKSNGIDVLKGEVYGHPMHKDGTKLHIESDNIKRWEDKTGAVFYETSEGPVYRTFHLTLPEKAEEGE